MDSTAAARRYAQGVPRKSVRDPRSKLTVEQLTQAAQEKRRHRAGGGREGVYYVLGRVYCRMFQDVLRRDLNFREQAPLDATQCTEHNA